MNLIIILAISAMFGQGTLTVGSSAFKNNGMIPSKYTCDGENINPPLTIDQIPSEAKSLAIVVDDPDAPKETFDHWILWNVPPTQAIPEKFTTAMQGKNGEGKNQYTGPCPPSGTHHYHFKVYALDVILELKPGADKKSLEKAMKEHILASGELIGLYTKSDTQQK